jgi:hypothetical protein
VQGSAGNVVAVDANGGLRVDATNGVVNVRGETADPADGTYTRVPVAFLFNDAAAAFGAAAEGAGRITPYRAQHVNLRDALGNEVGIPGFPVYTQGDLDLSASVAGTPNPDVVSVQGNASGIPLPVTTASLDTVGTPVTIAGASDIAIVAMAGKTSASAFISAGTLAATLAPLFSYDNGATYYGTSFYNPITGIKAASELFTNPNSITNLEIIVPGGATHVAVKPSLYVSGSATVTCRATITPPLHPMLQGPAGSNSAGWWARIGDGSFGPAAVKNIGAAAVSTDMALVVAVSPNNTVAVSSKTDLTPSAPATVAVGVASGSAVAANATRKGLILRNLSTARISLGFGSAAVLDSGVTLYPQDIFGMDEYDFDLGVVNAIASAVASNMAIQEYST